MNAKEFKSYNDKSVTGEIQDHLNPAFIFNLTNDTLLAQIAKGEINAQELAKRVLEARGLNINGAFVGFNSKIK